MLWSGCPLRPCPTLHTTTRSQYCRRSVQHELETGPFDRCGSIGIQMGIRNPPRIGTSWHPTSTGVSTTRVIDLLSHVQVCNRPLHVPIQRHDLKAVDTEFINSIDTENVCGIVFLRPPSFGPCRDASTMQ